MSVVGGIGGGRTLVPLKVSVVVGLRQGGGGGGGGGGLLSESTGVCKNNIPAV